MRIQHNISAMNSHRHLGLNNNFTSGNLEKLSSGFRINRAADDAAGLAISEKMRGQIRGLAMAENNTANGISLIQTAEGGLNETHSILQRMRELAVQSSNGTYDEEVDRVQLDKEFQAIKSEIDRIASSTHYNGIKLLDGSLGQNTRIPAAIAFASNGAMNPAGATQAGTPSSITFSGATGVGGANPAFSNLVIGDTITFEYRVDGIDQKFVHVITADDMIGDDMETGLGKDLIRALRAAFNDFDITMPTNIIPGAGPEGGITLVGDIGIRSRENGFETLVATGASVNKAAEGQITRLITVAQDATGSNDFREIDLALTDSRFLEIDGRRFQFVSDPSQLEQGNLAIFVQTAGIVSASDMSSVVGQLRSFGYAVTTVGIDTTAHPTSLRFEAGGMGSGLTLQIGANGGQDQRVNLFVDAMDSTSIGLMQGGKLTVALSSADIRTIETANMAIEIITGATNTVSGQRAALGALQNRLEHTMNNLAVSKENLTASESIIRDVDMAKEMMEFTKNQILVQASQAMLAQANQLPQGVLSLLR